MAEEAKVIGHDGLVRDLRTNTIVNSDEAALVAFRNRKIQKLMETQRQREFQTLKNDVNDIKSILVEILQKLGSDKYPKNRF